MLLNLLCRWECTWTSGLSASLSWMLGVQGCASTAGLCTVRRVTQISTYCFVCLLWDDVLYSLDYVADSDVESWLCCIIAGLYCLFWTHLLLFYVYGYLLWCVSVNHMHAVVPEEARREHQILWSGANLVSCHWVLGTEPMSSARTEQGFNNWAISSAPHIAFRY